MKIKIASLICNKFVFVMQIISIRFDNAVKQVPVTDISINPNQKREELSIYSVILSFCL